MDLLIKIGQLVLSLSILIVLHEFGHFLPARLFGTRVEKFYLFFDPYFSLFKKKIGETEYGIGWLPLGGYVKISGMIDESFDKEQLEQEPQPWEFRSKPAWQRLVIMLGGVTVNFILGFLLFAMTLFVWGEQYFPNENVTAGIYADSLGQEMGLRTGDKLLFIGDQKVERFNDRILLRDVAINNARSVTVNRDGAEQKIEIDKKWADILTRRENKRARIFTARIPFTVAEVVKDSPAKKAGLATFDNVVSVNGVPTPYYDLFAEAVRGRNSETIELGITTKDDKTVRQVSVTTTEEGKIGVLAAPADYFYDTETIEYGFVESFPAGFQRGAQFVSDQLNAFGAIFRGDIAFKESIGGFGSIAGMFGTTWIWERFWLMTASLSLILAIMNLLPIPALDGGHVVFLLYEVITGNKPSDAFMEKATMVGFVLVLALIITANGLDFWYWFKGLLGGG
ncbi:RIP metalloprotease RseP [Neolewinella antarctica]|uniref:Zinc metalloprotease n=1 Tax=Neolewinella antarctica TaxID=442734 RepID=A0ABX0XB96_9BACT|nr:RIP metalloprotease RseP [Neolewinella antarctica]NJC26204.1 regulator of sigma E protease [Neolewinella antarctica]